MTCDLTESSGGQQGKTRERAPKGDGFLKSGLTLRLWPVDPNLLKATGRPAHHRAAFSCPPVHAGGLHFLLATYGFALDDPFIAMGGLK